MTEKTKLKRAARARAQETGESYATARRRVVQSLDRARTRATQSAAKKAREAPATGAVSEGRCIEKTGHGFEHWFGVLDRFGAAKKGHTLAARHLAEAHGVTAWYCQAITVSYERARGLRAVNQRCEGSYEVSVSRVLPVSLEAATEALSVAAKRKRWLAGAGPLGKEVAEGLNKPLTRKPGAAHIRFDASGGRVELRVEAKDEARSTIVARVTRLADKQAMEQARTVWRHALDAVRASLQT